MQCVYTFLISITMTVNTTVTPIPTELLSECVGILNTAVQPRVVLNTYNSTVYMGSSHTQTDNMLTSEFMQYWHLRYGACTVCIETVTVPQLPTHRDVFNTPGSRQRHSHCVLNCWGRSIQLTVGGVDVLLPSNHWYLLHSQTPHSAVCEPPHSLITVDAHLEYSEYSQLLGLS